MKPKDIEGILKVSNAMIKKNVDQVDKKIEKVEYYVKDALEAQERRAMKAIERAEKTKDGLNGKDGLDGKNGKDGLDGIDGQIGARTVTSTTDDFIAQSNGSGHNSARTNTEHTGRHILEDMQGPSTVEGDMMLF